MTTASDSERMERQGSLRGSSRGMLLVTVCFVLVALQLYSGTSSSFSLFPLSTSPYPEQSVRRAKTVQAGASVYDAALHRDRLPIVTNTSTSTYDALGGTRIGNPRSNGTEIEGSPLSTLKYQDQKQQNNTSSNEDQDGQLLLHSSLTMKKTIHSVLEHDSTPMRSVFVLPNDQNAPHTSHST